MIQKGALRRVTAGGLLGIAVLLSAGIGGVSGAGPVGAASWHALPAQPVAQACTRTVSPPGGNAQPVAAASDVLGFQLFHALAVSNPQANTFISPASIALALDMLYGGARGRTQQAMAAALGLGGLRRNAVELGAAAWISALQSVDSRARLEIANSLWARSGVGLRPAFINDTTRYYGANVATLDFSAPQAATTINHWVSCATHGKITSVVDRIPASALMYLINAVYFKGGWTTPFVAANTRPHAFTTSSGGKVTVPLMSQTGEFAYYETHDFQMIDLQFGSGRFGMVVLLPRSGVTTQSLEVQLSRSKWNTWMSHLGSIHPGTISLPRFGFRYLADLSRPLIALGMGDAFSPRADFSGLCIHQCTVSDVVHKTYLQVNEKGATAAGVTSVVVTGVSRPTNNPFEMTVDHPFLVAIRDSKTGANLFMGAVNNPTS